MEKQEILSEYKRQEDKILIAQVLDKIKFSQTRQKIEYTDFFIPYPRVIGIVKFWYCHVVSPLS